MNLTLAEASKLAVQNHPQLAAARLTAAAAYQTPLQLRATRMPMLSGAFTGVGADSATRLAAGALNNPVVYNRLGSGLLINQVVTDFGKTSKSIAAARLRAQAQDQVTETTRANILVSVARSYFAVLRARAVLTVAEQTVSARQLVAAQVAALAQSNLKSTLDVSFANVNLADARLLLSQARNEVQSAETQLAAAIGLSAPTSFTLSEEAAPAPLPDTVEAFVRLALQDRSELKDLRLQKSAADRLAKAEHAQFFPSITLAGSTGVVPAGEAVLPRHYGAVGLNLSVPIFNGGLFRSRQTEAELRAKAASENLNDLTLRITRDVRVAYLNAMTAFERLGLTEQLLQQAQLSLELAQTRYDLGLSAIVELSQAQLNLTSAQIANAAARYDYQAQRVVVDYQIGALR